MANSSAKENANVKSKINEKESGIQDELQKCKKFIDSFLNIQKHHSN